MVLIGVAVCGLFAPRESAFEAVLVAACLWRPRVATVLLVPAVILAVRHQRRTEPNEAVFLQAIALELRAGASLRAAIESAAHRASGLDLEGVVRLARVGAPMGDIASILAVRLPRYGLVTGAALHTAGLTGGRVSGVFDSLAQIALEDRELVRERRAATAQARISAWIVGGIPVAFLAYGFVSGQVGSLVQSRVGLGIVSVGVALVLTGSATVAVMLKRSLA